jgi:hypothetical protein
MRPKRAGPEDRVAAVAGEVKGDDSNRPGRIIVQRLGRSSHTTDAGLEGCRAAAYLADSLRFNRSTFSLYRAHAP